MADDYQAIKGLVDIVMEIERRSGKKAEKAGKGFRINPCPFCGHNGCFTIDPSEPGWNCFSCDRKGSIIDYVMCQKNCSTYEALLDLAKQYDYELSSSKVVEFRSPANPIFEAAAEYYHQRLYSNSQALNHQRKVRMHPDPVLKAFKVGYADGRLYAHLKENNYTDDQILSSGLVKKKDGQIEDLFFNGLHIFPHFNKAGDVRDFTSKHPKNKAYSFRLPKEFKSADCPFYNMRAFSNNAIILLEGQNDLLTVYDKGGMENAVACCGQISEEQLKYLRHWAENGPDKTVYLCFDNDPAGEGYQAKVQNELQDMCLSPGLIEVNKRLLAQQEENRNKDDAGGDDNNTKKTVIPRVSPVTLKSVQFNKKYKDIDELLKNEKAPDRALKSLLENSPRYLMPLKRLLKIQREWRDNAGMNGNLNEKGEIIFDYFRITGKLFIDGEKCCIFYENKVLEIGSNIAFKSLLYKEAGLNYADSGTKNIMEVLVARSYENGRHTTAPGWIHTDHKAQTIYFNLCNGNNEIAKLSPGHVEIIPNGTNPEQILLRNSPKMAPIAYNPDVDIQMAMKHFKEAVLDNLACQASNKYFIAAVIFNTLLIQFTKARGIVKFSGSKASGKTEAASILTTLVYGRDYVTLGSAASDFSEASISPLTIADNLENDGLKKEKRDFLLGAATGVTKQKRKGGTDSENVYERVCSQMVVTAIEPFVEGELISRTNDISFDKEYFNPAFLESTKVEAKIAGYRDEIWSAFINILAYSVLPGFEQRRADALLMLKKDYRGHSKSRLDELYSCLFILCSEILKYIPHPEYSNMPVKSVPHMVLTNWLSAQDKLDRETVSETNQILSKLNFMFKECSNMTPEVFSGTFMIGCEKTEAYAGRGEASVKFIASSADLYSAFNVIAKNYGDPNPYRSVRQLSARIADSLGVLNDEGWEYNPHEKIVRGEVKRSFKKSFREDQG